MLVKVTDQTHIHCTVILRLVQSNSIPDVKFFDNLILLKVYNSSLNLIGWTLANAGDATLEQKLSLLQRHPDARNTTLARASYCEPVFTDGVGANFQYALYATFKHFDNI